MYRCIYKSYNLTLDNLIFTICPPPPLRPYRSVQRAGTVSNQIYPQNATNSEVEYNLSFFPPDDPPPDKSPSPPTLLWTENERQIFQTINSQRWMRNSRILLTVDRCGRGTKRGGRAEKTLSDHMIDCWRGESVLICTNLEHCWRCNRA